MNLKTQRNILLVVLALVLTSISIYVFLSERTVQDEYSLLAPSVHTVPGGQFQHKQHLYRTDFQGLVEAVNNSIATEGTQTYSFYFQNLNTGSAVGIRDKEPYAPGSLRKVPLMAAILRMKENGELTLDKNVPVTANDLDNNSGVLYAEGANNVISLEEALWYMSYHSDNTAANAVLETVGLQNYLDMMFNMGLSYKTYMNQKQVQGNPISAKEYSNVFRSLYYSSVLNRENSQYLLELLTNTSFNEGLPAGVPEDIVVSHKIGFWFEKQQHHDCGIIYYPDNPYILCVMTIGYTQEEADNLTAHISRITYEYVDGYMKE